MSPIGISKWKIVRRDCVITWSFYFRNASSFLFTRLLLQSFCAADEKVKILLFSKTLWIVIVRKKYNLWFSFYSFIELWILDSDDENSSSPRFNQLDLKIVVTFDFQMTDSAMRKFFHCILRGMTIYNILENSSTFILSIVTWCENILLLE